MLEEERTTLVETRNELDADLIADLIEYLMNSDMDESLTGDGRTLRQENSPDFS